MKLVLFIVVFICFVETIHGVVFSRCQLARELLNNGFPRKRLNDWVCLVESESSRNTNVIGPANSDGSHDFGLFQINSRYWCETGGRGKGCNANCYDFLSDNIHAASSCARVIYGVHGFKGWYGWIKRCQHRKIPDIWSQCGF